MTDITFAQLVALMTVGDGVEHSLRGVMRSRDAVPADDDEPADVDIPGQGRHRYLEERLRVRLRGDLARREFLDGRLMSIAGRETLWVWEHGHDVPTAFPRVTTMWGWPDSELTARREMRDWRGDDFTKAVAAPMATTFLGRDAWRVDLLPPPHKPFPLTLVVDAVTGLVLRQSNDGFGTVTEWEELELDVELPDELFEWHGPSAPPPDHRADRDRDMASRRAWLATQGIRPFSVTLPAELFVHEWDDDGAFQASLEVGLHASVARRPQSAEPWDHGMHWPHMESWTHGGWDWVLGSSQDVGADTLHDIRARLESAD
jgi:hypothetical protein